MRRVLVIGCSGAGKTTLSRRLAKTTGLPLIELDSLHWRPGWIAPATQEWRTEIAELVTRPAWIMDGNFAGSFDLRMPKADTVIWVDLPRHTCMRRVFVRIMRGYGRNRAGLPEGCPERLDWQFLHYIWTFNREHRPRIETALARFGSHLQLVHLSSKRDAADFLAATAEATCRNSPPPAG